MEPALIIDTKDYFNKSQYKGALHVVGDGRFGIYKIEWSTKSGHVPAPLQGTFTDTATAKQMILEWLHNLSTIAEHKERRSAAKVVKKKTEAPEDEE